MRKIQPSHQLSTMSTNPTNLGRHRVAYDRPHRHDPGSSRKVRGAAAPLVISRRDRGRDGGRGGGVGIEKVDGDLVIGAAEHSRVSGAPFWGDFEGAGWMGEEGGDGSKIIFQGLDHAWMPPPPHKQCKTIFQTSLKQWERLL